MNPEEYLEKYEKRENGICNKSGTNKKWYQISSGYQCLYRARSCCGLNGFNYYGFFIHIWFVPLSSGAKTITGIQSHYH